MQNRRLLIIVAVSLSVGFGATALLTAAYHDVRAERVRQHLDRGRALAASGQLDPAARQFGAALSIDRDNLEAARAVALTLVSLERHSEAESYLSELLLGQPTAGDLNRALARIQVARGQDAAARTSYQRAIYGEWPEAAAAERIATRFEVIDHLRRAGARDEVLAELIRLKAEVPPSDTAATRRIAALLLEQGAAGLAIQTLEAAAAAAPKDAQVLAHLADVQLGERQIGDAAATLRRATAIEPEHQGLLERRRVVDRILALDPTLPGLRLVTRTRRARLVLQAAVAAARACLAVTPSAEVAAAVDHADRRLRQRVATTAESAEQDLATASALWKQFEPCHATTVEGQALTRVLERVGSESGSA